MVKGIIISPQQYLGIFKHTFYTSPIPFWFYFVYTLVASYLDEVTIRHFVQLRIRDIDRLKLRTCNNKEALTNPNRSLLSLDDDKCL